MNFKCLKSLLFVSLSALASVSASATGAYAADAIKVEAKSSSYNLNVGRKFEYTVSITGKNLPENVSPTIPGFADNFKVLSTRRNRLIISGSSFTIIINNQTITQNEQAEESVLMTYFLEPVAVGAYTLGPPSVTINGQTYTGNELKVSVSETSPLPGNVLASKGEIFLVAVPSKKEVYVGEGVDVRFIVYLAQYFKATIDRPIQSKMDGFWVEEWASPDEYAGIDVRLEDGSAYYAVEISRVSAFPVSEGKKTVEPYVQTMRLERWQGQHLLRRFSKTIKSDPVTIMVKPLPLQDKPENFSELVGKFKIKAHADRKELSANETLKLTITLTGEGNIKGFNEPTLYLPDSIEKYDPEITQNIYYNGKAIAGQKTFSYILIPRKQGEFTIGPATVSYFDPESETYKIAKSGRINLSVDKSSKVLYSPDNDGNRLIGDMKMLNRDIRYIKPDIEYLPDEVKRSSLLGTLSTGFFAAGILVLAISLIAGRRRGKLESDPAFKKFSAASRTAIRAINDAKSGSDIPRAAQALSEAMYGYLSDKLSIQARSMTRDELLKVFAEKGMEDEIARTLPELLEQCDAIRFSSADVSDRKQITSLASEAKKLVAHIDRTVKWPNNKTDG